ncbi:hypothetical protein MRS76_11415 [Rhizobiaceae bacterium n13]|uniref:hypothetical protein n=1 Tax=Ferirhizobium litorale TaxID=2927786 RepID=UPI0024B2D84B|nr:hypothetical protein [Fererhizobium litorale]MDI7862570.1 hypothetical protein [Fererhizobium litorale]
MTMSTQEIVAARMAANDAAMELHAAFWLTHAGDRDWSEHRIAAARREIIRAAQILGIRLAEPAPVPQLAAAE